MSLALLAATAAVLLAAIVAAVSLWRVRPGMPGPDRRAYRWFAVAAGLWGASVIEPRAGGPGGGGGDPLSFSDLPSLLALPVMAAGFARLAAAGRRAAAEAHPPAGSAQAMPHRAWPTGTCWPPRCS